MDFDGAIAAHAAWKMKLSNYIRKPDKSLDALKISADNQCDLGKWLHGEGVKFATHPEYKQLKEAHEQFHKAAGAIIIRADKGESVAEEVALGASSEYAKASSAVMSFIMSLRRKV